MNSVQGEAREVTLEPRGRVCRLLLLAAGLALWWHARGLENNRILPIFLALGAGAVCFLPGVSDAITRALDRLQRPSRRQLVITSLCVGAAAILLLYAIARFRHRDFFPLIEDEFMYLLQARMLASGKLWVPAHPMADFFENLFVFVKPRYASIYFPGTALLNVPGIWLSLPEWLIPLLVSGAIAGLLYLILTELCGGAAGLLGALLLISLPTFRGTSIMVMSHPTTALLGEGMIFMWLQWRRARGMGWMMGIGALAGWAAITRPLDAVAFGAAVGIGILLDLRGQPLGRWARAMAILVLAAVPFLLLQIVFNVAITGKLFRSPYQMSLDLDQPQMQYPVRPTPFDPKIQPASSLTCKVEYYNQFLVPVIRLMKEEGVIHTWLRRRWRVAAVALLDHPMLLALLPIGLLGLNDRRRMVLAASGLLLLLLYIFNPMFFAWYTVTWMPAVVLLIVLGIEQVARLAPVRGALRTALIAAVTAIAVYALVGPAAEHGEIRRSAMVEALHRFETGPHPARAILLFQYSSARGVHIDPVYNISTVWPDDAALIHAWDLGTERDREIIGYYAARQPDREIITVDMDTAQFTNRGPAAEALDHGHRRSHNVHVELIAV